MKVYKGVNTPVKSSSWNQISEHFRDRKPSIHRLVEWIQASEYAHGLFAITSLDTLIIGQSAEFDMWRNVVRIDERDDICTIQFCEFLGSTSKRDIDGDRLIQTFSSLISSLKWFCETS